MSESSDLAATLSERLKLIERLASVPTENPLRVPVDDWEGALKQAAAALDSKQESDLGAALTRIDLLILEMCDE
ncbi:MAG: hypothetical protein KIT25_14855 [Enhydrobacter sp.]|nr:MAG: hypothetical protein KIT25_14855 [Enhydrobacter sp.]